MDEKTFLLREKIIYLIRDFFTAEGFHEVETPILVKAPDTAPYNEVMETELYQPTAKIKGYLTPSPEFFIKKLLVQGYKNIFQICKAFRNNFEGNSPLHNPEFTIMEWYRTNADYTDVMKDCENLVNFIYKKIFTTKNNILIYQNKTIDITPPWIRLSVKEAFKKYAKINLDEFLVLKTARTIAINKDYQVNNDTTWEQIYHQIFLNEIEPEINNLSKPIFLYDYPAPLAALSKRKKTDPRYAERFELYIAGLELGNAFSELTDWREQEKRLQKDLIERKRLKMKVFNYDHDFIDQLKKGLPETGGIAIGIDRLVMLFTNSQSIDQVIFFPAKKVFSKN